MVYLDNSSTTRQADEVTDLIYEISKNDFGNPSSLHSIGFSAEKLVENARKIFAGSIGADPSEITFNSGGTEGDNTVLVEAARSRRHEGKRIVISSVEHPAVLESAKVLEHDGFEIVKVGVGKGGVLDMDELRDAVNDDTILVSVMTVNNETGAVMPIEEVTKTAHAHGALMHTDAVQAAGHIHIDVKDWNVDLMSVSAHKFHGPKGVGFLYARKGIALTNLIEGGAQEKGKRAGTENVPGIMSMAAALQEAADHLDKNAAHQTVLRDCLIRGLLEIPHSALNGDAEKRLPGNVNCCFEGIEGESLLLLLDDKGISASSGSACTSGSLDPSHVLLAIGRVHDVAHGSLRLSIGEEITEEETDYIIASVKEVVEYLRSFSPVWRDLQAGKTPFIL